MFYLREVTFYSFKTLSFVLLFPLLSKDIPRIPSLRLCLSLEDASVYNHQLRGKGKYE
jgi:hypothetical protein